MILNIINKGFNEEVKIGILEVEEKPKTYKVINKNIPFYYSLIQKESLDVFTGEYVISKDLNVAIEIFKKGLEVEMEKEMENHLKNKKRIQSYMDNIEKL